MSEFAVEQLNAISGVISIQTARGSSGRSHTTCGENGREISPFSGSTMTLGILYNPAEGARNPRMSDIRILDSIDESDFSCTPVQQLSVTQGSLRDPRDLLRLEKSRPNVFLVGLLELELVQFMPTPEKSWKMHPGQMTAS